MDDGPGLRINNTQTTNAALSVTGNDSHATVSGTNSLTAYGTFAASTGWTYTAGHIVLLYYDT